MSDLPPWPTRATLYVSPRIAEYLRKIQDEGKLSVTVITQKPAPPSEEDETMECPECGEIATHKGTCSRSAMHDPEHPFWGTQKPAPPSEEDETE